MRAPRPARWAAHGLGGTSMSAGSAGVLACVFSCGRPERGSRLLSQAGLAERSHSRKREQRDGDRCLWRGAGRIAGFQPALSSGRSKGFEPCALATTTLLGARALKKPFWRNEPIHENVNRRMSRHSCFRFGVPGAQASSPAAFPGRLSEEAGWKPAIRRTQRPSLRRPGRARRGGASAGPSAPRRWRGRSPAPPRCRRRRNAG